MTGALLLSGLPCGEYGGGGSPSTTEVGNDARPGSRQTLKEKSQKGSITLDVEGVNLC